MHLVYNFVQIDILTTPYLPAWWYGAFMPKYPATIHTVSLRGVCKNALHGLLSFFFAI